MLTSYCLAAILSCPKDGHQECGHTMHSCVVTFCPPHEGIGKQEGGSGMKAALALWSWLPAAIPNRPHQWCGVHGLKQGFLSSELGLSQAAAEPKESKEALSDFVAVHLPFPKDPCLVFIGLRSGCVDLSGRCGHPDVLKGGVMQPLTEGLGLPKRPPPLLHCCCCCCCCRGWESRACCWAAAVGAAREKLRFLSSEANKAAASGLII